MSIWVYNPIWVLGSIQDVDVSPLANGDALIYNTATSKWEATALPWGWDMLKATYDTDLDWVVDTAHDVSATPLITRSSVASQWGLLINIDSATGDVARATNGWIEDEKYGWYCNRAATNISVEFDSAVTRTGRLSLKITVDASGRAKAFMYDVTWWSGSNQRFLKPVKSSTKYKLSCWVKTTNAAASSAFLLVEQFNSALWVVTSWNTTALTWTNDWTEIVYEVTTSATTVYMSFNPHLNVAWSASDAWFDVNSMTLEEVVEPVANSLTSSSPSLVSFTAVGSTDNIDQSAASSNSNWNLNNTANYSWQSFVPTKSKLTWIVLQKKSNVGTFTWTMTVSIVNNNAGVPWATVFASFTIPNATWNAIANDTDYVVNLPCNLTPWTTYWIRFVSSTSSATDYARLAYNNPSVYTSGWLAYWTDGISYATSTNDLFFKTLYYKPTTNFKASQNNSTMQISADEDGFLDWAVINLTTGAFTTPDLIKSKWSWAVTDYSYQWLDVRKFLSYHSATSVEWASWTAYNIVVPTATGNWTGYVVKVKMPVDITRLDISYTGNTTSWTSILRYSYDLVTWYTLWTNFHPSEFDAIFTTYKSYSFVPTANTVYIEFWLVSWVPRIWWIVISWTVDVSSLSTLRNYPTNKDVVTTYNKSLNTATTTATYRATLYGFPAIEYATGVYQYLNIDTTATWSTVAFSSDGSSYTTVADWANIALSSTVNPLVWVKHNITANRLYLSSNDYNASSDKDGSNKMTVGYQVLSQGLTYDVRELQEDVEALMIASGKVVTAITWDIRTEADVYTITPTATGDINLLEIPPAWKKFTLLVKTSGTTSYTLTFNTAFKSTGTLATWVVDAKYFVLEFISDGIQALELSRTTAM